MKIFVKVIPNVKKEEVRLLGKNLEEGILVKVNAPPEKNKANKRMIEILKNYLKAEVRLISGRKSRTKIVEIK
ncbi:MAG: DUF167 domain-containing protein [Candidatus Pacearchaeota archaeon]